MTAKLEEFLNELLQQVKNDNLSDEVSNLLGEAFLVNEMDKQGLTVDDICKNKREGLKYYMMGWYVYDNQRLSGAERYTTEGGGSDTQK